MSICYAVIKTHFKSNTERMILHTKFNFTIQIVKRNKKPNTLNNQHDAKNT